MYHVGIWETGGVVARAVREGLRAAGLPAADLRAGGHPASFAGEGWTPDLLVVSPTAVGWAGAGAIRPRLALLSGAALPLARLLPAGQTVSYGDSPRDALSLSRLEGNRLSLAVRRGLATLSGRTVERQELVLPLPAGWELPSVPAILGALLLLDVPAAELAEVR